MLKTITPIDNSILVERNFANDNEIETVLENAKEARNIWKETSLKERKEIVGNCRKFM
jgi:acyl-CoA reductase-like NAD-dependent aldehyde dehydrogenase